MKSLPAFLATAALVLGGCTSGSGLSDYDYPQEPTYDKRQSMYQECLELTKADPKITNNDFCIEFLRPADSEGESSSPSESEQAPIEPSLSQPSQTPFPIENKPIGTSPQEKRNNYDACLIEYELSDLDKEMYGWLYNIFGLKRAKEFEAETKKEKCVFHLK